MLRSARYSDCVCAGVGMYSFRGRLSIVAFSSSVNSKESAERPSNGHFQAMCSWISSPETKSALTYSLINDDHRSVSSVLSLTYNTPRPTYSLRVPCASQHAHHRKQSPPDPPVHLPHSARTGWRAESIPNTRQGIRTFVGSTGISTARIHPNARFAEAANRSWPL